MKIALLCPTRNRMNKVVTLISSLITTTKNPDNVCLVLGVDEDDPAKKYYNYIKRNVPNIAIVEFKNNGKFLGLSTMWNKMATDVDADIYAMIGDDMTFNTQDWDIEIISEFKNGPKDRILMVHCNDGMRGTGNKFSQVTPLCVNFFVHKNYINTVGYFVEPFMPNTHHDTWVQTIFDTIKRTKYRHDILIKHLHYSVTNEKEDTISTNLESYRKGVWDNNDWLSTYTTQITQELTKLRNIIQNNG